jgi:hypothetical protein
MPDKSNKSNKSNKRNKRKKLQSKKIKIFLATKNNLAHAF